VLIDIYSMGFDGAASAVRAPENKTKKLLKIGLFDNFAHVLSRDPIRSTDWARNVTSIIR
jgi:hypothetical protein